MSVKTGLSVLNQNAGFLGAENNKFHLPGLGRTISHIMSPAAARNRKEFQFNTTDAAGMASEDDQKVMNYLAK